MDVPHPLSRFDLTGKSALVVGAAGTLGRAGARALGDAGSILTIADLDQATIDGVAQEFDAAGIKSNSVALWPDSEANAESIVRSAVDAAGRLDVLFVALGTNDIAAIEEQSAEGWRNVLDANLDSYWRICQAAGRQFARQPAGPDRYKVAVTSSTRGRHGIASGYAAYCASKAGLDGMVRALAGEWGGKNININAIAPTVFRSPITEWMFDTADPGKSVRETMLDRIPIGRLGEADDLVGGLIYLLSPASDFMTGQTLYIDGGYTAI